MAYKNDFYRSASPRSLGGGGSSNTSASNVNPEVNPLKAQSFATDDVWANQDTIHYLSPATTVRTICEGDYLYEHFPPFGAEVQLATYSSESSISCEETGVQRTIAIVKPEAMFYKDVVLKTVLDAGFDIISQRTLHLTPEQVSEIYAKYYGCPIFPNMVVQLSSGPILVLSMSAVNGVEKWKNLVGPYRTLKSEWFMPIQVRKRFGFRADMSEVLHASENLRESNMENRYFFPENILEPFVFTDEIKIKDYFDLCINPTLLNGLTELCRVKPIDPVIFLAEWLLLNNPFKPKLPYSYAMAPT